MAYTASLQAPPVPAYKHVAQRRRSRACRCIVNAAFAPALEHEFGKDRSRMAAKLLRVYQSRGDFAGWASVPDDGFILLHVVSLLAEARRTEDMRCAAVRCHGMSCYLGSCVSSADWGLLQFCFVAQSPDLALTPLQDTPGTWHACIWSSM